MRPGSAHLRLSRVVVRLVLGAGCVVVATCGGCVKDPPPGPKSRYAELPRRQNVPSFLRDSIWEHTELRNDQPLPVSGYGLVVNLRGTGENTVPTAVRDYMIREMTKRGFGGSLIPGYQHMGPEKVLKDPNVSIVQVEGLIPPGARHGQMFDISVGALPESYTSSLAHGTLFQCELRLGGANPANPTGAVNVFARAQGAVFVNPVYGLQGAGASPQARASLRYGVVMDGGQAAFDRPLMLQLRTPQHRMARAIEQRINARFQKHMGPLRDGRMAGAKDDGIVNFYVPAEYGHDWERMAGVVSHLFLNGSPEFGAIKARELAAEAVKPDAPLMDISYCWEALDQTSLPYVVPLMSHPSPEVSYAAARAAAYLGEPSALPVLVGMVGNDAHPFQLAALGVLGSMASSPAINQMLRPFLEARRTTVRVEAYKALARNRDWSVTARVVREKFVLDLVAGNGPPLVHVTCSGTPRIALFGGRPGPGLELPITFSTMEGTFSISSHPSRPEVTLFYRGPGAPKPVNIASGADLAEVIVRLAGEGPAGMPRLDFSYSDVVGMLQQLVDQQKLVVHRPGGQREAVAMVMEQPPQVQGQVYAAPAIAGDPGSGAGTAGDMQPPPFQPRKTGSGPNGSGQGSRPQ